MVTIREFRMPVRKRKTFTLITLILGILLGHSVGEYVGVWVRPIDGFVVIKGIDGEGEGLLDG